MMHKGQDEMRPSPAAELQEQQRREIRWFSEFLERHVNVHEDRDAFAAALQRAVALGVSVEELRRAFEIDRSTAWRWVEGQSAPRSFLRKQVIGWIRDRLPPLFEEGGRRRVSRGLVKGEASQDQRQPEPRWIDAAPNAVRMVLERGGISDVFPPGVMIIVEAKVFVDAPPHERYLSFMGRGYELEDTGERKRELAGCRPLDALAWIQGGFDRVKSGFPPISFDRPDD